MATEQQRKALAVLALAEMFSKALSESGARMYVAALADVSADAVEAAAAQAAKTCGRFPPPAELREIAGESRPEDRAALAWEVVIRSISRIGGYRSPDFDDPTINATIRSLGGWDRLCELPASEQDRFTRGLFLKTYAGLCRTGISDELAAPLPGIWEKSPASHGRRIAVAVHVPTGLPWAKRAVKTLGQTDAQPAAREKLRLELRKP